MTIIKRFRFGDPDPVVAQDSLNPFASFSYEAWILLFVGTALMALYLIIWRPFFSRYARRQPLPKDLDQWVASILNPQRDITEGGQPTTTTTITDDGSSRRPVYLDIHLQYHSGCQLSSPLPSYHGAKGFKLLWQLVRHPINSVGTAMVRYHAGVSMLPQSLVKAEQHAYHTDLTEQMQLINDKYVTYQGLVSGLDRYSTEAVEGDVRRTGEEIAVNVQGQSEESGDNEDDVNKGVFDLCHSHPQLLRPCVSIHPARPDALELLETASRSVQQHHLIPLRLVKWNPIQQRINLQDKGLCVPFYQRMVELDMVLSVQLVDDGQDGSGSRSRSAPGYTVDPRDLRLPLDMGLKVVLAGCGGLNSNDNPSTGSTAGIGGMMDIPNFNLFVAMMEEPKYRGKVFGDLSTMVHSENIGWLKKLFQFHRIHPRIFLGSAYPLSSSAFGPFALLQHYRNGIITWEEWAKLSEVFRHCPLLYHLLLVTIAGQSVLKKRVGFSKKPTAIHVD